MKTDEECFLDLVLSNPTVREILRRTAALALPDWYLTAGCLFQTVWNVLDDQPPERVSATMICSISTRWM